MGFPGVVFALGLGIGMAAFLFYYMSGTPQAQTYSNYEQREDPYNSYWETRRNHTWSSYTPADDTSSRKRRSRNSSTSSSMSQTKEICTICLKELQKSYTKLLPCNHIFHVGCIEPWIDKQVRKTCPNCRSSVSSSMVYCSPDS